MHVGAAAASHAHDHGGQAAAAMGIDTSEPDANKPIPVGEFLIPKRYAVAHCNQPTHLLDIQRALVDTSFSALLSPTWCCPRLPKMLVSFTIT
jgi:hypothetical protein